MAQRCRDYVSECTTCRAANPAQPCLPQPTRPVTPDGPWRVVQIDTLELGTNKSGRYHCVLVCIDTFTKWVEVVPLVRHDAESVADAFVSVCTRWGPPHVIRSDNGTELRNALMSSLYEVFGVNVCFGAVRHPQSQGAAERFNQALLTLVRKVLDESSDWQVDLAMLLYFYRNRPTVSPVSHLCKQWLDGSPAVLWWMLPQQIGRFPAGRRKYSVAPQPCTISWNQSCRPAILSRSQLKRSRLESLFSSAVHTGTRNDSPNSKKVGSSSESLVPQLS